MGQLTNQIGEAVEGGWYALVKPIAFALGVNDQGTAQTVDLRTWRNGATDLALPAVVVQAQQVRSEFGMNGPLFAVNLSLMTITYAPDDADQTDLNSIAGDLEGLAINTTPDELTVAMTNVTCHGIEFSDETIEFAENRQTLSVDLIIHIQIDSAMPTTTTTTTSTTTTTTT